MVVYLLSDMTECRYDTSVKDNLEARQIRTKVKVLQRIIVILIWLLTSACILMLFDKFKMLGGTLLASAGVVSIVLGFSAQKTFGAMIAGLQVALSHPINLDDVVIVEGEWGRIEEITFTYVVVTTWDLRRLIVPITYFLETPFQNWTKKNADIIGSVFIHADYTVQLEPLREELNRLCIQAKPLWDGKTCVLQVTDAGPETLTLRADQSAPLTPRPLGTYAASFGRPLSNTCRHSIPNGCPGVESPCHKGLKRLPIAKTSKTALQRGRQCIPDRESGENSLS